MSTATEQQEVEQQHDDEAVACTVSLTAHEWRVLHLVLGVVMDKPGTFGVRGNGSAETKRILIDTALGLRDKIGTPPPPAGKTKPAKKKVVEETTPKPNLNLAPVPVPEFRPAATAEPAAAEPAAATTPAKPEPAPAVEPAGPAEPEPAPPAVVEAAVESEPAPAPAAETTPNGGTRHFLIVYSRTKKKPVAEREFDTYQEAFGARTTEAAQWPDEDDVETHVITGPNRKVLVSAQPQYFRARPPKARVGG